MPLTILNGKKIDTSKSGKAEAILENSLHFTENEFIVQPQSTNVFLHAEVILCGMNISMSHEKKGFTLIKGNDLNATPEAIEEPGLIDATDKFFGVDPSLDTAQRSQFFNLDDELTEAQKRNVPKSRSKKQICFLTAINVLSSLDNQSSIDFSSADKIINPYFEYNIKKKV